MNTEEIKKLTVADLKKELKARNLTVSGIKTELVQRLSEHLLTATSDEQQILEDAPSSAEDGDFDSLLEGVAEDDVLGLSSDEAVISLSTAPSKMPEKRVVDTKGSKDVAVKATESSNGVKSSQEEAKKISLKIPIKAADVRAKSTSLSPVVALDSDEKKLERAKKFNTGMSEADKKKLRAERFGTGDKNATSASTISTTSSLDPELLQKRAQRFGLPVVKTSKTPVDTTVSKPATDAKLQERAERFGLPETKTAEGTDEKLMKRKMRFTAETDEKKKARAERFGMASK